MTIQELISQLKEAEVLSGEEWIKALRNISADRNSSPIENKRPVPAKVSRPLSVSSSSHIITYRRINSPRGIG